MFSVIIAGVRGAQLVHLRDRLPTCVLVRGLELNRLLRVRAMKVDLVICTRFMSHKHHQHLQLIAGAPVVFVPGGIGAWAAQIVAWYSGSVAA